MRIRPAQPQDIDLLGPIALAAKAFWGYSSIQLETWRMELTPTAASVMGQPTFVAELNGQVCAFYQLSLGIQEADLAHLWVHPHAMGCGVGHALLAHAMRYLGHLKIGALHIDADPGAAPFYQHCGALPVGKRPAPIKGQAARVRPQFRLFIGQADTPSTD